MKASIAQSMNALIPVIKIIQLLVNTQTVKKVYIATRVPVMTLVGSSIALNHSKIKTEIG